jgi:hypothetical protein
MIQRRFKAIHIWILFQPVSTAEPKRLKVLYKNILKHTVQYTLYDDTKVPLTTEYSLAV